MYDNPFQTHNIFFIELIQILHRINHVDNPVKRDQIWRDIYSLAQDYLKSIAVSENEKSKLIFCAVSYINGFINGQVSAKVHAKFPMSHEFVSLRSLENLFQQFDCLAKNKGHTSGEGGSDKRQNHLKIVK